MNTTLLALPLLLSSIWLLKQLLLHALARLQPDSTPLADRIDALLPQTQCGQCGHPGCRPYAEAMARGENGINLCPPGGEAGIRKLAKLLDVPYIPFAPDAPPTKPKAVAVIDELTCIGCTLCIQACPVDAIVGAAKHMHTVITSECTGCELCIAPCPVDCITMTPPAPRHPVIPIQAATATAAPIQDVLPALDNSQPCIRCGDCASVCPEQLQPMQLLFAIRDDDPAASHTLRLADCSECGHCDSACPSHIPLLAHFRQAKDQLANQAAANLARKRHRFRQFRLQRDKSEKAARLAERAAAQAAKLATAPSARSDSPPPVATDDAKQAAIAAAMARAAAQREASPITDQHRAGLDEAKQAAIEAAMARAAARKAAADAAKAGVAPDATAPATAQTGMDEAKQAAIEAAMARAAARKAAADAAKAGVAPDATAPATAQTGMDEAKQAAVAAALARSRARQSPDSRNHKDTP